MLYQAGARIREILKQLPDTGRESDYEIAKDKLKGYFEPQKNNRYEVYRFRQATQDPYETLDQFHTRLRTLSQTCEFNNTNFEIEQQILVGGTSSKLRKRALRDPNFKLADMLLEGRRDEQSKYQAKDIEAKEPINAETHKVNTKKPSKCYNCGQQFPHKGECPAKGKTCNACGKSNHFAIVCRSGKNKQGKQLPKLKKGGTKNIHRVENDPASSDTDDDYLYAVRPGKAKTMESPKVNLKVCGHLFKATIDTGATINVIDQGTFSKFKDAELKSTKIKAFSYNSTKPVEFLGKFDATIETRKRLTLATFYVVKAQNSGNLLCAETAQELNLISLHVNKLSPISANVKTTDPKLKKIVNKHASVFTGIGKLKNQNVKLSIDESVLPKAQPQRRIPYHIRDKVTTALKDLESEDVIERVPDDVGTPWVSPITAVPKKDGGVRICVDMRQANEAIRRVRHPIPTVDDVSFKLNGATCFSKLDLSQAYHQLELHPDSRYITTFSTHDGLYRYKRLNYGTNASAEIFQYNLQTQLQGLTGVANITDDIIVFGTNRTEHDENLDKCLQRLSERGFTLNGKKCKFLENNLEFFGQIFSGEGTRPDPKRVADLKNAAKPSNVQEVRSLLGMANYSSKYVPDFATITAPLRELTKKNAKFEWKDLHQKAFEKVTNALSSEPCMAYFDKNKETFVIVDASPVGVSGILAQKTQDSENHKVVAYASRTLTNVEQRYSQTEKEALAIVWAVEHFHLFLFGNEFTLVTDHKPLEVIYGSTKSKPSARNERWALRLQPYSCKVIYKPGEANWLIVYPDIGFVMMSKGNESLPKLTSVSLIAIQCLKR